MLSSEEESEPSSPIRTHTPGRTGTTLKCCTSPSWCKLFSHSQCFPKDSLLLLPQSRFSSVTKGIVPVFSFSMKAFIASLICLQLERLGVFRKQMIFVFLSLTAPTRAFKESRPGPHFLSQLGNNFPGLSFCQAMCGFCLGIHHPLISV